MTRHYFFGPVPARFAEQNLKRQREAGKCLTFDFTGPSDLTIDPADTWEAVCARLPVGWLPDFIVLYLPYQTIPACLWSAPVPIVGLAADWNLQWHWYRRRLRSCELILTDTAGVDVFHRAGLSQARAANLFGLQRDFLEKPWPDGPRDIDILFVGNLHPAVQRERLPWLGRLPRLGERWKVAIHTGVYGDSYRELLGRARIVFNRSTRGECNLRVFEAAAAGALLFQEADNREVAGYFQDRQECVFYSNDNLEALLEYYLEHEDERQHIAGAARNKVQCYRFEDLWERSLELIEAEWPGMVERARRRPLLAGTGDLLARTWQALGRADGDDPALVTDLAAALVDQPQSASLHNALGLTTLLANQLGRPPTELTVQQAAGYFQRAVAAEPSHAIAGLNVVEALASLGQTPSAIEQAKQMLAVLNPETDIGPGVMDSGHFPLGFDLFRVEWERAAWAHAGRPADEAKAKRALLRWRLHALLGELTGDLVHYFEAALLRPDLPATQAALGCALGRVQRPGESVEHLRRAVASNPFDLGAARALFVSLGATNDGLGQRRLARDRRLLSQAAPQPAPAEPWFTNVPHVGDELASIIILCCNELDFTRQCLESLLRHTRPPYEVILVDNGSTDATPAFLEEIRGRAGPTRVVVIRNEHNLGFPAGCNQGLAQTRGRYLVLLNNDTIVTENWLDGLITWSLHEWPSVGLVGPVTNRAFAPQQIGVTYADLDRLPEFAARRRREYGGKAQLVERLSGFCMLVRREVLDKIGSFDERFGIGFFDDDDLGLRARQAGFRLLVAQNVFIHHFGSRTFIGLGINCAEQLRTNFERFKDKWGAKHAAPYQLPDTGPKAADSGSKIVDHESSTPLGEPAPDAVVVQCPADRQPRVSLSMIVRNEEDNLTACIGPVRELVEDIVVVDTGSTDRTKEVAAQLGARVFDFPWVDSFAAARNESLKHAKGKWVFWMDADDRVDAANREKLSTLFAGLKNENAGFVMKCLCLPDPETGTETEVDHVRLFPNHPQLRWKYRVHEQILPGLRQIGSDMRWVDIVIQHVGYQDHALRGRKLQRDLRLLQMDDAEQPDDPFTLFNLGSVYLELERPAEALPLLQRSLKRSEKGDSIVRKLYALIAVCLRRLHQTKEALAMCQEGRWHYHDDVELLFQEAIARAELGDRAGAEAGYLRCLQTQPGKHFASLDTGLRGYKARHNLAVMYRDQGRVAEAEAQWRAAVAEQPSFTPAWSCLAELYLILRRWPDLEQVGRHLENGGQRPVEGACWRARGHLARREFTQARGLLEETIARAPHAVGPRRFLTHALLQEGRDWFAAEHALRELLTLNPGDAEARNNLVVLLRQQRQPQQLPEYHLAVVV